MTSKLFINDVGQLSFLENPNVTIGRKADKYGECTHCHIFGVSLEDHTGCLICRDCYSEIYMPIWIETQTSKQEEIRKERLKDAFGRTVRKRHKRGLAPINLRH